MIAVVDETTPEVRGQILYVVVCAVILTDEATARAALGDVIPTRKRPFHWHDEGRVAREAMVAAIETLGVLARAKIVACGRRGQEAARAVAMRSVIRTLLDDVCPRLIIESRGGQLDARDRHIILDVLRDAGASGTLSYEWRDKGERLLWVADSVAGTIRTFLDGSANETYERFSEATALDLEYLPAESSEHE